MATDLNTNVEKVLRTQPKTADGAVIYLGMEVWVVRQPSGLAPWIDRIVVEHITRVCVYPAGTTQAGAAGLECYSTEEAALAYRGAIITAMRKVP